MAAADDEPSTSGPLCGFGGSAGVFSATSECDTIGSVLMLGATIFTLALAVITGLGTNEIGVGATLLIGLRDEITALLSFDVSAVDIGILFFSLSAGRNIESGIMLSLGAFDGSVTDDACSSFIEASGGGETSPLATGCATDLLIVLSGML